MKKAEPRYARQPTSGVLLPPEVWDLVWTWDDRYRLQWAIVMAQLRRFKSLEFRLKMVDMFHDAKVARQLKSISRNSTKRELLDYSRFKRVRQPRSKTTKWRLLLRIYSNVIPDVIWLLE